VSAATLETHVAAALAAGDIDRAATLTIRELGPEVLGFLRVAAGDAGVANEAFSQFSINVWRGLPGLGEAAALRSWCYVIARRSLSQVRRKERHAVRMSTAGLAAVVEEVRTATPTFLQTAVRAEVAALRAELDEDDRMLLTLRVDRGLPWRELAQVFAEDGETIASPAALDRQAAALRKRYERIKRRIRALAEARGIVDVDA
jgi:RNA polymerase sigma-70 factor (ECF subfamily)